MIGRFQVLRDIMRPLPVIHGPGEAVALFGVATSQLLHPISSIVSVWSYTSGGSRIVYTEGVDYERDGTGIRRLPGSAIYDFNNYTFPSDPDGTFDLASSPRNPPIIMWRQVYVDYVSSGLTPVTISALASSPTTGRVLAAGDSITLGAHTPAQELFGSDADSYVGMLRSYFSGIATVDGFSTSGSTLSMLTSAIDGILAASNKPQILLIAYGMNDHTAGVSGVSAFQSAIDSIVTKCLAASCRPILIGFFKKNEKWRLIDPAAVTAYNNALATVASNRSVPFVNISSAWDEMGTHKNRMLDMTGDNFHHPNVYGQRLYFSKILPNMLSTPVSSASVPNYIR